MSGRRSGKPVVKPEGKAMPTLAPRKAGGRAPVTPPVARAAPEVAPSPAPGTVLLISLFHPELVRGGAQLVCYELFEGLKTVAGCRPVLLCAVDSSYPALYKSGARITGFDGRPDEFLYLSAEYDYLWHKTGSSLHLARFEEFLRALAPDVVHFHHFLTMGIDWISLVRRVLPAARIVFTFHEFLAICHHDGHMIRRTDGSLCDHASPVRCHQCYPDYPPEHFLLRRMWFQRHLAAADVFTCPSRFMIDHYANWGLPRDKLRHVGNGQRLLRAVGPEPAAGPKTRFAFFGQYVDSKGLHVILRAVHLLRSSGVTGFTVDLNGDNLRYAGKALRDEFETFLAAEMGLPEAERIVRNNGSYDRAQLPARMARTDWCIVPSVWWEIFGMVISEAWMFGKPVICSDAGGMKERVRHDIDGLHFTLGDPAALAATMRRAMSETGLWERLRKNLPAPPARESMVAAYLDVYADAGAGTEAVR